MGCLRPSGGCKAGSLEAWCVLLVVCKAKLVEVWRWLQWWVALILAQVAKAGCKGELLETSLGFLMTGVASLGCA